MQGLLLGFTESEIKGLEIKYKSQGVDPQSVKEYQDAVQRRDAFSQSGKDFEQQETSVTVDLDKLSERYEADVIGNSFNSGHLLSGALVDDCYTLIQPENANSTTGAFDTDYEQALIQYGAEMLEVFAADAPDDIVDIVISDFRA